MITQYPWVSVKAQERKHIELGLMITMLVGIITLYSVPKLGPEVKTEPAYVPPPVEMISIPATVQPPARVEPMRPAIPTPSESIDMDDLLPEALTFELIPFEIFAPPEVRIPEVPIWAVEVKPKPIGGYVSIMRNVIYPEIAREAGMQGMVTVEALIGKDGIVKEVTVVKGIPNTGLDEAALAAVLKTPFTPAYQRDKPVQVRINIPIIFTLH